MSTQPEIPADLQERYTYLLERMRTSHTNGVLVDRAGYWMDHEQHELELILRISALTAERDQARAEAAALRRKVEQFDRSGKCLNCGSAIDPKQIGLCNHCFGEWLKKVDADAASRLAEPEQEEKQL